MEQSQTAVKESEQEQPPMTPATQLYFPTPDTQTRAGSDLFDLHELRGLIRHLRQGITTPGRRGGSTSTLYDSYELEAVATQLSGALRAAARSSMSPSTSDARILCHGRRSRKLKRIAGPDESSNSAGIH